MLALDPGKSSTETPCKLPNHHHTHVAWKGGSRCKKKVCSNAYTDCHDPLRDQRRFQVILVPSGLCSVNKSDAGFLRSTGRAHMLNQRCLLHSMFPSPDHGPSTGATPCETHPSFKSTPTADENTHTHRGGKSLRSEERCTGRRSLALSPPD